MCNARANCVGLEFNSGGNEGYKCGTHTTGQRLYRRGPLGRRASPVDELSRLTTIAFAAAALAFAATTFALRPRLPCHVAAPPSPSSPTALCAATAVTLAAILGALAAAAAILAANSARTLVHRRAAGRHRHRRRHVPPLRATAPPPPSPPSAPPSPPPSPPKPPPPSPPPTPPPTPPPSPPPSPSLTPPPGSPPTPPPSPPPSPPPPSPPPPPPPLAAARRRRRRARRRGRHRRHLRRHHRRRRRQSAPSEPSAATNAAAAAAAATATAASARVGAAVGGERGRPRRCCLQCSRRRVGARRWAPRCRPVLPDRRRALEEQHRRPHDVCPPPSPSPPPSISSSRRCCSSSLSPRRCCSLLRLDVGPSGRLNPAHPPSPFTCVSRCRTRCRSERSPCSVYSSWSVAWWRRPSGRAASSATADHSTQLITAIGAGAVGVTVCWYAYGWVWPYPPSWPGYALFVPAFQGNHLGAAANPPPSSTRVGTACLRRAALARRVVPAAQQQWLCAGYCPSRPPGTRYRDVALVSGGLPGGFTPAAGRSRHAPGARPTQYFPSLPSPCLPTRRKDSEMGSGDGIDDPSPARRFMALRRLTDWPVTNPPGLPTTPDPGSIR